MAFPTWLSLPSVERSRGTARAIDARTSNPQLEPPLSSPTSHRIHFHLAQHNLCFFTYLLTCRHASRNPQGETGRFCYEIHIVSCPSAVSAMFPFYVTFAVRRLTIKVRPNPKHVGSTYLKSDSQTLWSRNATKANAAGKSRAAPEEVGASAPLEVSGETSYWNTRLTPQLCRRDAVQKCSSSIQDRAGCE